MNNIIISENVLINNKKKESVFYWENISSHREENISNFLEENRLLIRHHYLEFIDNLRINLFKNDYFKKLFKYDKYHNLWDMSLVNEKCPIKSPKIIDCLKLISLELLISKNKPKLITIYSNDKNLAKSIIFICNKKNIKYIDVNKHSFFNYNLIFNTLGIFNSILFIIKFIYRNFTFYKKYTLYDFSKGGKNDVTIFSYLTNYEFINNKNLVFYSKYWYDFPQILVEKYKNLSWCHIPTNNLFKKTLNKDGKNFKELVNDHIAHTIIYDHLTLNILGSSIVKFFYISVNLCFIKNISNKFIIKKKDITLWPLLKDDWIKSTRGSNLFYSIIMIKIFDNYLSKIPKQKLGIYLFENQSWEKSLISSWKKNKHGKIIGVAHSSIRFWDLRYYDNFNGNMLNKKETIQLPDFVAVNGKLSKEALLKNNFPIEKLLETEALRYNYLLDFEHKNVVHSENKILLLGDINKNNTNNMLSEFNKAISALSIKYTFEFRSHPGNQINLDSSIHKNIIESNDSFSETINRNSIIVVSGSSTSAIEALILNKNVIIFIDKADINLSPLSEVKNIKYASNSNEILNLLNNKKFSHNIDKDSIFWLNKDLLKWKKALKIIN